jgi:hypothetical protein
VTFGLPMTVDEFTKERQDSFRQAIASVLAVNVEQVRILAISAGGVTPGRRLLNKGIEILIEIDCGGDTAKGASMVESLNSSDINSELAKRGLPRAEVLEATVAKPKPAPKTSLNIVPIAVSSAVAVFVLITAITLFVRYRRSQKLIDPDRNHDQESAVTVATLTIVQETRDQGPFESSLMINDQAIPNTEPAGSFRSTSSTMLDGAQKSTGHKEASPGSMAVSLRAQLENRDQGSTGTVATSTIVQETRDQGPLESSLIINDQAISNTEHAGSSRREPRFTYNQEYSDSLPGPLMNVDVSQATATGNLIFLMPDKIELDINLFEVEEVGEDNKAGPARSKARQNRGFKLTEDTASLQEAIKAKLKAPR